MLRRAPRSLLRQAAQLLAGDSSPAALAGGVSQLQQHLAPSGVHRTEPWHLPAALPASAPPQAANPWTRAPLLPRLGHRPYSSAPGGDADRDKQQQQQQQPDGSPGPSGEHQASPAQEHPPAEEPPSLPPLHPIHQHMREHGSMFHRVFDEGGAARWAMGMRSANRAADRAAPAARRRRR
jgi:hypothetical protein